LQEKIISKQDFLSRVPQEGADEDDDDEDDDDGEAEEMTESERRRRRQEAEAMAMAMAGFCTETERKILVCERAPLSVLAFLLFLAVELSLLFSVLEIPYLFNNKKSHVVPVSGTWHVIR
jgi:hypothetical protein